MIFSAIIEPDVCACSQPGDDERLWDFIRLIAAHGILLDDEEMSVLKACLKSSDKIKGEFKDKIRIFFEEICLKISAYARGVAPTLETPNVSEKIKFLVTSFERNSYLDVILVRETTSYPLSEDSETHQETLSTFKRGAFNDLYQSLSDPKKSFSELNQDRQDDLIARCIRFESQINFYDYVMAQKEPHHLHRWNDAIKRMLKLRRDRSPVPQLPKVFIYTSEYEDKGRAVCGDTILERLGPILEQSLNELCSLKIIVKENPDTGIVHERLIAAGGSSVTYRRVFVVTPGIDGLDRNSNKAATINPPRRQWTRRAKQYENLRTAASN